MYLPQSYAIKHKVQVDDGIGGFTESWGVYKAVEGYLDLLQGTDLNNAQNAFTQESTHVLVIPSYVGGITDAMRVVDESGKFYEITFADDPVNINHHIELYLKYGGVMDG